MDVELLVIPDCPNAARASALVESVLAENAWTAVVTTTVIATEEHAHARAFGGSPTILLDGIDPFAEADSPVGLSCRIYRSARGSSGVPDRDALREAMARTRESAHGDE